MKNSKRLEEENDLTLLRLRCGSSPSPKRARRSSPSPSPSPSPSSSPSPSLLPIDTPQTNISLVKIQLIPNYLNPFMVPSMNHNTESNPNLLVSSSSDDNSNPPNAHVNVPTRRSRRAPTQGPARGKSETVPAPFPWATDRRATVYNYEYLLKNKILTVTGNVRCKRCEEEFDMSLDVNEKVGELRRFIEKESGTMHDRAPAAWVNPELPKCPHCGRENSVKPILGNTKKKTINWLFLLLGQTLGCCTLEQLKYFCKHTKNHRTGAKDRLLYLTYMTLCKQFLPELFDSRSSHHND